MKAAILDTVGAPPRYGDFAGGSDRGMRIAAPAGSHGSPCSGMSDSSGMTSLGSGTENLPLPARTREIIANTLCSDIAITTIADQLEQVSDTRGLVAGYDNHKVLSL